MPMLLRASSVHCTDAPQLPSSHFSVCPSYSSPPSSLSFSTDRPSVACARAHVAIDYPNRPQQEKYMCKRRGCSPTAHPFLLLRPSSAPRNAPRWAPFHAFQR
ncbi:hypothetical protein Naga_100903g2 [Nannochloropsis gaditana]|uniref:Uncharacterized protein n=1 Tax=Nannochloropsis gaditana TaxID=72520 RepID=W7TK09_9STRA|nr:hypothetical protein Naga_100903g2 [Nannochloropsis gaditana]